MTYFMYSLPLLKRKKCPAYLEIRSGNKNKFIVEENIAFEFFLIGPKILKTFYFKLFAKYYLRKNAMKFRKCG